ncbi:MAG: hypothetical protein JOZ83_06035 [Silvibacterium sp.]|nr:hypothetical protein [Silvibacterium sp.]
MTIDERLEKLTERHEALTLTVENLEHRLEQQAANIDKLIAAQAKTDRRIDRFYTATLRLGADLASRLQKLEDLRDGDDGEESEKGQ